MSEHDAPDAVTKVARDLSEILDLAGALETQIVHKANDPLMPGGLSMVALAAVASPGRSRETINGAERWWNTGRPLTRSSGTSREGLAMKATRICSIEGCGRKHIARGWCQRHYNRWAKNGTPHLNKLTLRERFEAHYVIEDLGHDTPCWRSTYAVNRHTGYTAIRVDSPGVRRVEMMHRVAYELYVGPIPEGLHIDHLCRQRVCCNPAHLEPVTPGENALRGESPFAKWARQTHCVHGHEFSPENTRRTKTGGRECKECNLERNRQRRARARAAKEAAA